MTAQQMLLGTSTSGGAASQSLSFVTANTANGAVARLVLTHPAGVQVGDLCVLFQASWDNDSDFVDTAPTGFTMINTYPYLYTTTTYLAHAVSYNVLASTASVTLPLGNGDVQAYDGQTFIAMYFRPSVTITSVAADNSITLQNTGGNPAKQTVPAAGNTAPLIVFGHAKCLGLSGTNTATFDMANSTPFDGFAERDHQSATFGGSILENNVAYKIYNTSPLNHDVDMADLSTNSLLSFYLKVS